MNPTIYKLTTQYKDKGLGRERLECETFTSLVEAKYRARKEVKSSGVVTSMVQSSDGDILFVGVGVDYLDVSQ